VKVYTFVLEYAGGTYVSQYPGGTVKAALQNWAAGEAVKLAGHWKGDIAERLFARLAEETPVVLDGLHQVWCASASLDSGLALLNIVATDQR
jgi:hypothetical protein